MQLIFIYGPPASGKLTVAEQLSKLTSISLFHNHLTRDLVKDIYGDELKAHYDLVDKLRIDVFEYCAQKGTDLIFTYVYGGVEGDEESIIRSYIKAVEFYGGKVKFVELTTNDEDLLKRVENVSRRKHQKLLDPKELQNFLQTKRQISIPFVNAFKIDTSRAEPEEAARLIANEFGLQSS
jgi:hypothetical protein